MQYTPDPKSLVYSELYFISTSVPRPQTAPTMDSIIDEVSAEIFEMFIGVPMTEVVPQTVAQPSGISIVLGTEIAN